MALAYKTRTEFVVDAIREKILKGEVKAGQPLRQAALAEDLDDLGELKEGGTFC